MSYDEYQRQLKSKNMKIIERNNHEIIHCYNTSAR